MVDMRDAILLADQVDFNGASQDQLWAAFAKRGFGALAYAPSANSLYISASYEPASKAGKLKLYDSKQIMGDSVRVLMSDLNNSEPTQRIQLTSSSGDLENVVLRAHRHSVPCDSHVFPDCPGRQRRRHSPIDSVGHHLGLLRLTRTPAAARN